MIFTIEVFKNEKEFVAKCNELNIYTYGSDDETAVKRLKEVINFYIKSAAEYMDIKEDMSTDKINLTSDNSGKYSIN